MPEIIPVTAPTSALTGAPTRDVVAAALIPEDTEARTVLIVVNDASIAPVSLWKAASKLSPSYPSFLNRCEYSSILLARLNLSAMDRNESGLIASVTTEAIKPAAAADVDNPCAARCAIIY